MRQRYWFRNGDVRDADGLPMLSHNELAHEPSQIRTPQVMRDIPEYRSPIDGKMITSRSYRREDLKANDCVEVDPPKRPRGYKNERFAKKRGLKMNPEIAKDQNSAERHNRTLYDSRRR